MRRPTSSRRRMLRTLAATGAATLVDPGPVLARLVAQQPWQTCADPATTGTLLGTLPLFRAGWPVQPFGVKFGGAGLDARLVTDLSLLEPDRLITPNALAYIRTECPPAVAAHQGPWIIKTSGLMKADARGQGVDVRRGTLTLDELTRDARSMGPHLFECSGNNNPANFGLMSVAEWDGVPLSAVVSRLPSSSLATGVLVSGVDHDGQRSADSIPGASWIFPLSSLDRLGAFIAVRMNGEPVPLDHGRPLRLVVPGWYGCAWIKWVNEVRLVGPDEPATSQMREFAGRTHQTRRHDLAREYAPAEIQTAATPVRVEKRRGSAGLEYPYRRHRLGRHETCRSPRDSFRRSGCVETVVHLSRAPDSRGVGAVGLPLEARNYWTLQHCTPGPGFRGAPASARQRLLHAAGEDR